MILPQAGSVTQKDEESFLNISLSARNSIFQRQVILRLCFEQSSRTRVFACPLPLQRFAHFIFGWMLAAKPSHAELLLVSPPLFTLMNCFGDYLSFTFLP